MIAVVLAAIIFGLAACAAVPHVVPVQYQPYMGQRAQPPARPASPAEQDQKLQDIDAKIRVLQERLSAERAKAADKDGR